jgi:predicted ferric reductase
MSTETRAGSDRPQPIPTLRIIVSILSTLLFIAVLLVATAFVLTPAGQTFVGSLKQLFAADSIQLWWYVTRAAGIVAYLLLWFSTVLGLAVKSKFLDRMLDRMFTYDFHEFISLLSIGFILLHVIVLLLDRYLPYSLGQVLIPFLSPYRPLWVGIGVIAFYVTLLVTVTFYLRTKIGQKAFRLIHVLSLVGYLGVTLHGLYAGTDAVLPAMKLLYDGTGLVVLFFTVYWLALAAFRKTEVPAKPPANLPIPKTSSRHRYGVR